MNSLFFKGSFVFGCKNINIILKYNAMFIIFLKKISFTQTVKFTLKCSPFPILSPSTFCN